MSERETVRPKLPAMLEAFIAEKRARAFSDRAIREYVVELVDELLPPLTVEPGFHQFTCQDRECEFGLTDDLRGRRVVEIPAQSGPVGSPLCPACHEPMLVGGFRRLA